MRRRENHMEVKAAWKDKGYSSGKGKEGVRRDVVIVVDMGVESFPKSSCPLRSSA
jgi:hypothetical protein